MFQQIIYFYIISWINQRWQGWACELIDRTRCFRINSHHGQKEILLIIAELVYINSEASRNNLRPYEEYYMCHTLLPEFESILYSSFLGSLPHFMLFGSYVIFQDDDHKRGNKRHDMVWHGNIQYHCHVLLSGANSISTYIFFYLGFV